MQDIVLSWHIFFKYLIHLEGLSRFLLGTAGPRSMYSRCANGHLSVNLPWQVRVRGMKTRWVRPADLLQEAATSVANKLCIPIASLS